MTDLTPDQQHVMDLMMAGWSPVPSTPPIHAGWITKGADTPAESEVQEYLDWYATLNEVERGIMTQTRSSGVIRVPFPSYAETERRQRHELLREKTLVRCYGPARWGLRVGVFATKNCRNPRVYVPAGLLLVWLTYAAFYLFMLR